MLLRVGVSEKRKELAIQEELPIEEGFKPFACYAFNRTI